jgi:pyruvate/2-oxoglutarate dehydrogenase complex dihydrolipoamide dehydrogenase (E3) component
MKNTIGATAQRNEAPEEYDLLILGSGAGSKLAAWTFASRGQRVAVVERKYVGGSCPNIACLPSKNIIHTAQVASYVRRSEEFGIAREGFRVDMQAVRDRKRKMVAGLVEVHLDEFRQSGAELIMGTGRFTGPRTVEVTLNDGGRRVLRGTNVVIGTGTHAAVDKTPGLAEALPLTHIEALELDEVPERLLIIGGGYIGLEFAQAMRRFGSNVTVIDHNERLLHREDDDVTDALHQLFDDDGITAVLNARVKRVFGEIRGYGKNRD